MNNRSFWLFLMLGAGLSFSSIAQSIYPIPDSKPIQINGIEYGYTVQNEHKKDFVNLGPCKRYELMVYVTNKSGTTKVFNPRQTSFGVRDQDLLAHFDCTNATGAKLTSRTIAVRARAASAPSPTAAKPNHDEAIAANEVQPGHMLANGETITNNIIVIVPDGEQPQMRVRIRTANKSLTH